MTITAVENKEKTVQIDLCDMSWKQDSMEGV